jgi:hypothetical protein
MVLKKNIFLATETKTKRQIFTSLTSGGIFTSSGLPGNNIVNSLTAGGTFTSINGMITITNSTGVYMGSSLETLKKVDGGASSINVPPGSSVSITNGVITLTNSSGTYVGRSMETLIKI